MILEVCIMGWLTSIIIGAIVGWLAEKVMKFDEPWWKSTLIGIAGGFVGGWIASLLNIAVEGWISGIIFGLIGACILVFLYRIIKTKVLNK